MGLLETADSMVDNSIKELNNVLNSKFTTYLQGVGTPVLCTYYNMNDITSTLNSGTLTPDQLLGDNSPLRYNKIVNFPIYGLKDFIPDKVDLEGGLIDLEMNMEVTTLPNTIKPTAYDYIVYEFMNSDRIVIFQVNDFEFSSIRSNSYYKLSLGLKDINDRTIIDKLERQVEKHMTANLETIGTNDKCIIEDDTFKRVTELKNITNYLIERYIDTFYDDMYNAVMLDYSIFGYPFFDPFITQFIIRNNVLDDYNNKFIVLINYDTRYTVMRSYNKSFYRQLELQDMTHVGKFMMVPEKFHNPVTNPFSFYGNGAVFTIDLTIDITKHPDPPIRYEYINNEFMDRLISYQLVLDEDKKYNSTNQFWNIIINYMHKGNIHNLISRDDLDKLLSYDINYAYDDFMFIPVIIFILKKYISYVNNN